MASRLLDILRNIDNARLKIINTVSGKGYPVNKQTNLTELNTYLFNNLKPASGAAVIGEGPTEVYYDDPEDDPECWTGYKNFPDIYSIFKELDFETYNSKTLYPIIMFSFTSAEKTINIRSESISVGDSSNTNLADNLLMLPYIAGGAYVSINGEALFVVNTGSSATVACDLPEPIIGPDGNEYYYIICYKDVSQSSTTTNALKVGSGVGIDIKELIFVPFELSYNPSSGDYYVGHGSHTSTTLQSLIYADYPVDTSELITGSYKNYKQVQWKINPRYIDALRRIVIDLPEFEEQLLTGTNYYYLALHEFVNTVISTNKYISSDLMIPQNLFYLKTAVPLSYVYAFPSTQTSVSYLQRICNLKYCTVTNHAASIELANSTAHCAGGANTTAGYACFPRLNNYDLFKYSQSFNANAFIYTCINVDTAQFYMKSNPTSLSGFSTLGAKKLIIENVPEFSLSYLRDSINTETLILPDATRLSLHIYGMGTNSSDARYGIPRYLVNLVAPNVTELVSMATSFSSTSIFMIGYSLKSMDLSSLTKIPHPNVFKGCQMLEDLVLGQGFESSIAFTNLQIIKKESILDLFNKLKTLTAAEITEGRTVTLPTQGRCSLANFTAEELAIATDKGWVVK